jgi:alanine dehydrogenase
MRIGVPREIKILEGRVALVPEAAADLVRHSHEVLVQSGAGLASGYSDDAYRKAGVEISPDAAALYQAAQLVIKVKEPEGSDLALLRRDHLLFCFLHLAAAPDLARRLMEIGLTAVAFETVEEDGRLPLLAPMSDIAGRLAVQIGTHLLHRPQGGKGLLLGGLPAAERGHVVILGAGVAGGNAAALAAAMGARVTVFDKSRNKLEQARALGANVTALYPYAHTVEQAVREADLLIGAVLIPGERAPCLVSAEAVRSMQPGSVVVDVSVDQGGCIATTRPSTYADPTYTWEGVVHFAVTNMPGAVPRTASQALSAALTPYALSLADPDWEDPDWKDGEALRKGVNVAGGKLVHPALQKLRW